MKCFICKKDKDKKEMLPVRKSNYQNSEIVWCCSNHPNVAILYDSIERIKMEEK